MKTTPILAASLLVWLAGCANENKGPTSNEPSAPTTVSATTAVRVHGDVIPSRLVAIALPARAAEPTLSVSMPGLPKKAYTISHVAEISTRRDFARVVSATAGRATGTIDLPIDAPAGARVIVSSRSPHGSLPTVHLRDSAGTRLDQARDEASMGVRATRVVTGSGTTPLPRAETGIAPSVALESPFARGGVEPGFRSLTFPRRILSIDVPAKPGRVSLDVPAAALADGIEIDVQQPNSAISLAGAPRELNYGFGDVAEVEYTLANGEAPIEGATFTGSIELPNGDRIAGVTFASEGAGKYVARVPLASADLKTVGVWHVHAKATGTVNGLEFERDIDSGFGYSPAHARMVSVHQPETIRGADGLIDEIKVDVDLETVVDDRLGLSGTLVFVGADGVEHSVGLAQTSADIKAGTTTMSLHFESKDVALSQFAGPYVVRDLALVSHAFAVTQHRLGRGLDLRTPSFAAHELRYPTVFSPAVEEAFELGDLVRK